MEAQHIRFTLQLGVFLGYIFMLANIGLRTRRLQLQKIVSGLVLLAKSCSNDVSRLTFWSSNMVVLRELICQTFGNLSNFNATMMIVASNGGARKTDEQHSTLTWKNNSGNKKGKSLELLPLTLAPHMQMSVEDLYTPGISGKLLGSSLGDQQQGKFSTNLWKSAFHDAFSRICPVRAGGHECGGLPVLARTAHEIPTDPISDPIVDPRVLPIPAGDLSFGSGAHLKNSIGNWSRW